MNNREPSIPSLSTSSPVTLHAICAMTFLYRKLYYVCRVWPFVTATVPCLCKLLWIFVEAITNGQPVVAIIMTVILFYNGLLLIKHLATSSESLDKALHYNQVRLPLFSFFVSCALARYAVGPLLKLLGFSAVDAAEHDFKKSIPDLFESVLSLAITSIRYAVSLFILSLAVILRYMSNASIMRCSCVPLATNTFYAYLLSLRNNPFSIAQPGDTPGDLLKNPFLRGRSHGRRFKYPTWSAVLAQCILSVLLGMMAVYSAGPIPPVNRSSQSYDYNFTVFLLSSSLTVLSSLVVTALRLDLHELDPKRHSSMSWIDSFIPSLPRIIKWTFTTTLIVLFLAILGGRWITSFDENERDSSSNIVLLLWLTCYNGICIFYLLTLDECIRTSLFDPNFDLEEIILLNGYEATPASRLDVILHCLLIDSELIQEVWTPSNYETFRPGAAAMTERRRSNEISTQLSKLLLTMSRAPELMLETDIIRIAVLEHLGGKRTLMNVVPTSAQTPSYGSVESSYAVQEWLEDQSFSNHGREPLIVPLVRALCGFIGGIGEAVYKCTQLSTNCGWALPKGLIVCAEYAVVAVARCVIQGCLTLNGRPSWISTHVSTLIPTCLISIFRLRNSLLWFAGVKLPNPVQAGYLRSATTPISSHKNALALAEVCDYTALEISLCLNLPPEPREEELPLDIECLEWLKQLHIRRNEFLYVKKTSLQITGN